MAQIKQLQAYSLIMGCAVALGIPATAHATLIATYAESPGQQVTSVTGASTLTFDSVAIGANNNLAFNPGGVTLGTYNTINVKNADQYGGANNSRYPFVQGYTSTLTLTTRIGYFGMWWSAGDNQNVLEFYDNTTLIGRFTTANLLSTLPLTYRGNPTPNFLGQNSSESYAYLNFFSVDGTKFNRILITNGGSTGFESDNHAVREAEWNIGTEGRLPGVIFEQITGTTSVPITATQFYVPEPGSMALCGLGAIVLVWCGRRTRIAGKKERQV